MAARKAAKKRRAGSEKSAKVARKAAPPPQSGNGRWDLRLYIAGDSPRSRTALANLKNLCEARLKDRYQLEVIDLTKRPDLAKADQILAVPTLIRKIPEPMKRIIGDLSNAERAVVALEIPARLVGGGGA